MQIEVLLNGSGECLYSEGRRIWPKYSVVFSDTSMTQIGRIRILRLRKQNMRYQCGRISSSIPPTQAAWHKSCMRRQAHDSSSTLVFRWICVARLLAVFHQRWMNANGHTVLGQGCLGPITIARADTQQYAFLMSDSPWIASRVISFFFSRWRVFLSFTSSCLRFLSLSLSLFLSVFCSIHLSSLWDPYHQTGGFGCLCPFHEDRRALSPLSVTVLFPVFLRS